MTDLVSVNGKKMSARHTKTVTPVNDNTPKTAALPSKQKKRREENEEYLKNRNVKAFLDTIAAAEKGDYHAKFGYGWAPGFKTGKWTFTDESTHPGPGYNGTSAAGRYQIMINTWRDNCVTAMGLSDFTPKTQDLTAIEGLRKARAIDSLVNGDIKDAIHKASFTWEALPLGPGQANRPLHGLPSKQPYMPYEDVVTTYKKFGGTTK
ncbi:hypothetical protein [Pseudomonas frederiksbergensis]|uniref:Paar repeat-containing protein n=1 Tax=Pseudomonas frederiksbergensis TaxID=104087 RepID=A0A6L5BZ25_9PSED|nr:hypothetical protein [Pseudomonas frederiksbergensis]KAF2394026.1 hypothetical protein FX983_02005 [Pseudomonas frederiksbergensis]